MGRKSTANEKRKVIMDAFKECVVILGLDNASMKEVALRVNLDRSSLHYYYPKREKLVAELVENITLSYIHKLESAISSLSPGCAARQLVDYLFSAKWHNPDLSQLIDEISTAAGRTPSVEDPISSLYKRCEKRMLDIFIESFPDSPKSEVREACYAVHQLAEGSSIMTSYNFPENRRRAGHKAAIRIIESLELEAEI